MVSLTVIVVLFTLMNVMNAKEIKIQIDSADLLNIVGGLMNNENFRKVADQFVRRTAMKFGTYNNPYHPEDNIVESFDEDKDKALPNKYLDEENKNFISGAEDREEDQLTEGDDKGGNDPVNVVKPSESPIMYMEHKIAAASVKDTGVRNFIKRRFELKSSN